MNEYDGTEVISLSTRRYLFAKVVAGVLVQNDENITVQI